MIVATQLRKSFGTIRAVDEVSFTAGDGEITGLLGPNGAGKTTSLRMVYGLISPDRGSTSIDGIDPARSPREAHERMGVLPDARGIYARLTARENVRYFGRLHGLVGDALEARIEALSETLDMGGILDRRAAGFSQGERMKVALARALVHDPHNVLLDEPTNGLDVMSTRSVRELIRRLREEGRCVLFSSHVMPEVSALCDRVVVVARGRVVADGTGDELLARTGASSLEDAFVALIGSEEGLTA